MLNALLSHLCLGVSDRDATRLFYEDNLGLRVLTSTADVSDRLGLGGSGQVLSLVEGRGLQHFALEVRDDRARQELVERLGADGTHLEPVSADPDHPDAFAFLDPDGHRVEIHARVSTRGADGEYGPRHRPIGLHHITLATKDVPALVDFYVSVLGFAISDRMGDRFVWMRCNHEHHTVAVVKGEVAGIDHYCFEVRDWNELKVWCDTLAADDVRVRWGPGRHGPGNNLFIMFDDPDDIHIELSCEMERFWDDNATYGAPRNWASEPRTVNLWGPVPEWRTPLERVE